jgi:hypothetical protein
MRKPIILVVAALALTGFIGYVLLVADWFDPHSTLTSAIAVTRSYDIATADLDAIGAAAKEKYGPTVHWVLHTGDGIVTIERDGKVIEETGIKGHLTGIPGIIAVGQPPEPNSHFPFNLEFDGPNGLDQKELGPWVRTRFEETGPKWLLTFGDNDWSIVSCWRPPPAIVGPDFANAALHLGAADLCLIRWQGSEPARLLVGGVIAEGGLWVRIFARRVCRSLAESWVKMMPDNETMPDYVACILVHAPENISAGAAGMMTSHIFERRASGSLARIQ